MKKASLPALLAFLTLLSSTVMAEIAYISDEDGSLSFIDLNTLEVVETMEVGKRSCGIIFNKDKTHMYVCASESDTVQILDVKTKKSSVNRRPQKIQNNL